MFRALLTFFLTLPVLGCGCWRAWVDADQKTLEGAELQVLLQRPIVHSAAHYQSQAERARSRLSLGPCAKSALALAEAQLGLRQFEAAAITLDVCLARAPSYSLWMQRARVARASGDFPDAIVATRKALELRPERNDYRLRMLRWQANPKVRRLGNFLGLPYTLTPEQVAANPRVSRKALVHLIRQEPAFADAYLVLGDVLMAEKEKGLAAIAYHRAVELGSVIDRRRPAIGNPFVSYSPYFEDQLADALRNSAYRRSGIRPFELAVVPFVLLFFALADSIAMTVIALTTRDGGSPPVWMALCAAGVLLALGLFFLYESTSPVSLMVQALSWGV
jgi:tetratricopeptide (TPR) repeat protein